MTWLFIHPRLISGICAVSLLLGFSPPGFGQRGATLTEFPNAVSYCDYCLASQGISPLEVGSTGLRVDVRYLSLGSLYQDGAKVENSERELETHFTQQYSLYYSFLPRFSLGAFVPIAKRHSEQLNEAGQVVTGNEFGLADLTLLLRYKALVSHDMETTSIITFSVGAKLPTGKTDGRDSEGELLDAHIQLGSGSTDVLLGASGFLTFQRVALIANLLGAITSKGANGHQFGDILNYDASIRYRLYPSEYDDTQLFATFGVYGELRGKEVQDGAAIASSGGNVVFLSPGFQLYPMPSISIEASYHIPIVHALNGEQLGEDYRIMAGVQFLLN
jgi:hypothetical protein